MAIQITQMARAQVVKNSSVNQSISEVTLRWSVGSAKAANAASGGRLSSKLRSEAVVVSVEAMAMPANHNGSATWRLASCLRQRHSVHKASGSAGQVNHSSKRPRLRQSLKAEGPWLPGNSIRQRHRSSPRLSSETPSVMPAMSSTQCQECCLLAASAPLAEWPQRMCADSTSAPPMPSSNASVGAPLSARPAMPISKPSAGPTSWVARR